MPRAFAVSASAALLLAAGCTRPGDRLGRRGDEIVVAGQLFHTGTPVVLWLDPRGYDAYRARRHFEPAQTMPANPASPGDPNRYGARRLPADLAGAVAREGWTLENLRRQVDQFVIHYDVCGTSRQCFKILQDARGLSVPFMLDIDGVIYQTLDLKERAWHAGQANDRSVGIEIAHIGAYKDIRVLDQWYATGTDGWPYITLPSWMRETGVRTAGFIGRPARKEPVRGRINGQDLVQYDFTAEQYAALIRLTAALHRALPGIRLDYPRGPDGRVRDEVLSDEELAAFQGLLGHWHITRQKVDPGPAFDWERVVRGARSLTLF